MVSISPSPNIINAHKYDLLDSGGICSSECSLTCFDQTNSCSEKKAPTLEVVIGSQIKGRYINTLHNLMSIGPYIFPAYLR